MAMEPGDIGERIRQVRGRLGLTQTQFANQLGVSFASVNRWENGKSRPNRLAWQRILRAEETGVAGLEERAAPAPDAVAAGKAVHREIDFTGLPGGIQALVESLWLSEAHRANPAFATETALIEPLPHQRIAVYERMLNQPRLRFLLADDAGAGKTIMAGLYIREMLARRLIRRVLIVPPAGLVGNWLREMERVFRLSFNEVRGADANRDNPFVGSYSDLAIVSVDTLAGDKMFGRLQEAVVEPYDLVIFDEAHKLSARRDADGAFRPIDRYRLAEAVAGVPGLPTRWHVGWSARHLLLLTATPHMGKDEPYFFLWRLLDPQVISTPDAFAQLPADVRSRHFIRRIKEEMVHLDDRPLYPTRVSDTLSYDLAQGEDSEQALYDRSSAYIRTTYNRARILNRSAARFAMSIFQRRLASSTWALLCSLRRRLDALDRLIDDVRMGRVDTQFLLHAQRDLDEQATDPFEEMTADESASVDGREQEEVKETAALGAVVATSLAELVIERQEVAELVALAESVERSGQESKLDMLRELCDDPRFGGEKLIVFTEHKDTLDYLVRRLNAIGHAGRVASIHGGMSWRDRDAQVEFFRRPESEGGARFLVATDAAGEGINLQFCWLMVNFDVPWNPARLEQRMGRVHRYGQPHDPVVIVNLVAARTREGKVLKTLLDKLETIRKELGSDKVFDVVGRIFEGRSIRDYMAAALDDAGADAASAAIDGVLQAGRVRAVQAHERAIFGRAGEVRGELGRLRQELAAETFARLLPGFIQRHLARSVPLLGLAIEGDLGGVFSLRAAAPGAMDHLLPRLEAYPEGARSRLTTVRPTDAAEAIFLHPGEPVFDGLGELLAARFGSAALRGGRFVDPCAEVPYLLHVGRYRVVRRDDHHGAGARSDVVLEQRVVAVRQGLDQPPHETPVESLLLLRPGADLDPGSLRLVAAGRTMTEAARAFVETAVAGAAADRHRAELLTGLPERLEFVRRGFDFEEAELAQRRALLAEKARAGNKAAQTEVERIREQQRAIARRREEAVKALERESERIEVADVELLAHAVVVPSADPEDRMRYNADVEAMAVGIARAHEEALGAVVRDVSTPPLARAAGLTDWPGFDLLSRHPDGTELGIEVKGRAAVGDIELKENEWARACNLRDRYWLYVVYDCATAAPRLLRVQDPFGTLIARAKGGVLIAANQVQAAAAPVEGP